MNSKFGVILFTLHQIWWDSVNFGISLEMKLHQIWCFGVIVVDGLSATKFATFHSLQHTTSKSVFGGLGRQLFLFFSIFCSFLNTSVHHHWWCLHQIIFCVWRKSLKKKTFPFINPNLLWYSLSEGFNYDSHIHDSLTRFWFEIF